MNEEQPITRSSMVPVLGCIALMLFGLNFYQFLDRELFSKWRTEWCDLPSRDALTQSHNGVFAFEFDRAQQDIERAQREIERAHHMREHALQQSMERAQRQLARLQRHADSDVRVEVNIARLQEELEAKTRSLQALEGEWPFNNTRRDWKCEMDHEDHSDFQIHIVR